MYTYSTPTISYLAASMFAKGFRSGSVVKNLPANQWTSTISKAPWALQPQDMDPATSGPALTPGTLGFFSWPLHDQTLTTSDWQPPHKAGLATFNPYRAHLEHIAL